MAESNHVFVIGETEDPRGNGTGLASPLPVQYIPYHHLAIANQSQMPAGQSIPTRMWPLGHPSEPPRESLVWGGVNALSAGLQCRELSPRRIRPILPRIVPANIHRTPAPALDTPFPTPHGIHTRPVRFHSSARRVEHPQGRCEMAWEPKKLRVRHEQIMDFMLLHPAATHAEIAEAFECTKEMISMLVNSDLFQYTLRQRRERFEARVDDHVMERLNGRVARLATVAVEKLVEGIEGGKIDLDGVRDTCDMALKNLGFGGGGSRPIAAPVQPVVVVVDASALAEARARMRGFAIEHDPVPAA